MAAPEKYTPGAQIERSSASAGLSYLFFCPRRYGSDDSAWPLILFLHGAGERGNNLVRVKRYGPPQLVESDPDFPFLVASPQCPSRSYWEPNSLIALLDEIIESEAVDRTRIYLTGVSMGGYGTWYTALAYPDRFAAIAPICGGGLPREAARIKLLPVWAFHGEQDDIVPVSETLEMVEALQKAGGNVRVTIYPDLAHACWTEAYGNPELFEWLLKQRKPTAAAESERSASYPGGRR